MSKKFAFVVFAVFLGIASVAYAATASKSGTGPNIPQRSVDYVQTLNVYQSLPVGTSGTIGSVSYSWLVYPGCYLEPISGSCIPHTAPGLTVRLCLDTYWAIDGQPSYADCTDVSAASGAVSRSGSTSAFSGRTFTGVRKPRFYLIFRVSGSGYTSPTWQGRTNTVTMSY